MPFSIWCPSSMHDSPHIATVEAFYARVIKRVCSSYREENEFIPADEAIKTLQQKWQEKLALYTGARAQSSPLTQDISAVKSVESSASEDEALTSSSASASAASVPVGRPSTQLPSASTSSTFAKMLGGKRKLKQLDGSGLDDEDVEWQDAVQQERQDRETNTTLEISPTQVRDSGISEESKGHRDTSETEHEIHQSTSCNEEEKDEGREDGVGSSIPAKSTTSTSLLVSTADLSPVSGLSGINLPLQLAAEYSKFIHRGKRRGYFGQLHAIVLTWPSSLGVREAIHPGDLVWCCSDSGEGFLDEGDIVKVVSLVDNSVELRVEYRNENEYTVHMDRIRRLKEYLVCKGSVRF